MTKTLIAVAVAGTMMLFSAGSAFAHETGLGDTFKAMPKQEHMKAFPQGHPATDNPLNRCFWNEKEALYFCQYPLKSIN